MHEPSPSPFSYLTERQASVCISFPHSSPKEKGGKRQTMVFVNGGGGSNDVKLLAKNLPTFAIQVIRGRWFMVFASLLIMAAAGGTYIFGIYSKDIKTSLGYNQQTLNTLSFFKDLGANVGVISGLINEISPPWVVLSIGAAMNLFGYLMIYLAIKGKIARPAVWQLCIYICVAANSQSFANTGALVTCVKNFPEGRGIVLGLLKGFVGLSGAIFTQLYVAIYGDDSKSLVLLIAWLPAAVSIVFVHTIRIMDVVKQKENNKADTKTFFYFLYISIALATYLMIMIIVEKLTSSRAEYSASAAIVIFLLFLPLAVVVKEEIRVWNLKKKLLENPPPMSITVVNLQAQAKSEAEAEAKSEAEAEAKSETRPSSSSSSSATTASTTRISCLSKTFKSPDRGEDYSILQALVSIDMIVLFVATICGVGGTLTAIDNMGQIGQSLGYPPKSISTFVSLISIWNYTGRVVAGFLSEILLSKYKFPRPLMLTITLVLSCIGHLLIAFGVPNSLYFSSVIIGFCFGAQWPLLFAIISEIFGLKYYSTLYNFGAAASPIGSYILSWKITGHLYDREAAKQNHGVKEGVCMGVNCFKQSFLIVTAATAVGVLVSLILVWRSWDFYKGDIYARFRAEEEEEKVIAMEIIDGGEHDGGGTSTPEKKAIVARDARVANG